MRGIVLTSLVVIIFFGWYVYERSVPMSVPTRVDIVLTSKGFVPDEVSIKRFGTVTFSTSESRPFWPASNVHPNHGIYAAFDPKQPIVSGKNWSFIFDRAGDFGYHDHLRPYFTGTIHVVE